MGLFDCLKGAKTTRLTEKFKPTDEVIFGQKPKILNGVTRLEITESDVQAAYQQALVNDWRKLNRSQKRRAIKQIK